MRYIMTACVVAALAIPSMATGADSESGAVNIGAILDGRYQDGERAFSEVEDGFGLGHTELSLSGSIDSHFRGVLTTVLETVDGDTELDLEEAFFETIGLASGLNIRGGRMLSQFGYLNGRHKHDDDFADRPAVYRAYLGGHYFDDGIGAELVLPARQYMKFGIEAFDGEKLAAEGVDTHDSGTVNAWTGQFKIGGDASKSSSWQFGLSYLDNDLGLLEIHDHEEEEEEHDHGEEGHDHNHGPAVTGSNLYGLDLVWKWAPGNPADRQLTLSAEYLRLDNLVASDLTAVPGAPSNLDGWYLSAAFRFSPSWTAGLRYGEVDTFHGHVERHDDHFHGGFDTDQTREIDFSIAWHPSHFSTVRGTVTRERQTVHGQSNDENIFVLQYVMSLGAHGAHAF